MTQKTRLLGLATAVTLYAGAAFAAINGNQLADDYLAEGYDFVEVKVGLTQTKVEAIRGTTKVEVIYDNETFAIIKTERETADGDDVGRTGKQVRNIGRDFEDDDDGDRRGGRGRDDDDDDHGGRDHDDDDDNDDDDDDGDSNDDDDDDDDDDNSGSGSGRDDD